jgi:hypothetical protein
MAGTLTHTSQGGPVATVSEQHAVQAGFVANITPLNLVETIQLLRVKPSG